MKKSTGTGRRTILSTGALMCVWGKDAMGKFAYKKSKIFYGKDQSYRIDMHLNQEILQPCGGAVSLGEYDKTHCAALSSRNVILTVFNKRIVKKFVSSG